MDTSLSAHQSLQLNSLAFVIFVCVAVVGYQITAALTRGNAKVLRPVRGLVLFALKFVFADMLYPLTGFGSADALQFEMSFLWLSFFIQLFVLFLDFAGYTHMMIGIGGLLGFKLAENFNRPFVAQNVQEFWERWHMSLTSFIQDYIGRAVRQYFSRGRARARSRFS